MIRAALIVLMVVAAAVVMIALRGEPGSADITWFHWNVRATAATAALLLIFFTLAGALFWRGLIWLAEAPRRAARARAESRRRQGSEALTRGFLAAAAGDGAEPRRPATRAPTWSMRPRRWCACWPPRPPRPPATQPARGPPTTPCWASPTCA
jgi:HemY protein